MVANDRVLVMEIDEDLFSKMSPAIRDKINRFLIELLIERLDEMNTSLMNIARLMRT